MAIVVFTLIGLIPNAKVRKRVNDVLFKSAFRLMCRPLSAVVTFHNTQYRPGNLGCCVANHTSPMDVCILGADRTYSLVRKQKQYKQARQLHIFYQKKIKFIFWGYFGYIYIFVFVFDWIWRIIFFSIGGYCIRFNGPHIFLHL